MTNEGSPVQAGEIVAGKYLVRGVIGTGGMGVVVSATHQQLDQQVALKFLLGPLAKNGDASARFVREARAVVKLTSEHVARAFDVGTLENGTPYLVMELLDGADLAVIVDSSGPFTVEAAATAILHAIDAIAEAHALGIVHRDLKSANLFLARRGTRKPIVKVLDFGISKVMDSPDGKAGLLTSTKNLLGSPAYMAPEQMRSARNVDGRADIWALGVILYELLTATLPFDAASLPEVCLMVTQDPFRSPKVVRSDLPDGLVEIINRCLEKDPDARYASVLELAASLEPYAAQGAEALATLASKIDVAVKRSSLRPPGAPPASDAAKFAPTVAAPSDDAPIGAGAPVGTMGTWSTQAQRKRRSGLSIAAVAGLAIALLCGGIYAFRSRSQSVATRDSASSTPAASASSAQATPEGSAGSTPVGANVANSTSPSAPTLLAPDAGAKAPGSAAANVSGIAKGRSRDPSRSQASPGPSAAPKYRTNW